MILGAFEDCIEIFKATWFNDKLLFHELNNLYFAYKDVNVEIYRIGNLLNLTAVLLLLWKSPLYQDKLGQIFKNHSRFNL